jgi:hypothetical protein
MANPQGRNVTMRMSLLAFALVLGAPVAAQTGITVWSMRVKMPDSLQARAAGIAEVDTRITLATDGNRLGFQVDLGDAMASAMPGTDLSAMRLNAVVHANGDSASIGIILPPEIAAMAGGGIGFRYDVAIPDSIPGVPVPNVDSLMEAQQGDEPDVTNTGRTATVAGITCEEWTVTPKVKDATATTFDHVGICVTEDLPALRAFTTVFERHLPDLGFDFDEMKAMGRKWFGGRDIVAIRTVMGADRDIVIELVSSSTAAPDASFFTLPEGLQPFPMEMVKAMLPTNPGM